ncbi:MAG: hypothetical protein Q8K97_07520 [Pseudohongiella sp.]|nr:hypothetical protein [Pseudohongiella sp.]
MKKTTEDSDRLAGSDPDSLVIAVLVVLTIWMIVLYFIDRPVAPHEAYRHAAEASLLEGQPKPEGHGR